MPEVTLQQLTQLYLKHNYDYLWLKTMLAKAVDTAASGSGVSGASLITGSSHALNAIYEPAWSYAVNCSMHSQDIYYDFQCAKRVIQSQGQYRRFSKCFIVMGYYIAFQDLSKSKVLRESLVTNIYYPIFGDAHNWEEPAPKEAWAGLSENLIAYCEKEASQKILGYGTYYSPLRQRGCFFDLKGRKWAEVSAEEREKMGQYRAESHNKLFQHKDSFLENKKIFSEYVRFLHQHDVTPVVVITPFTDAYNRYVNPEMKQSVLELLNSTAEDVHYVDFNDAQHLFDPEDFMDTDHMSERGAKKVSFMLTELFGR